MDGIFTCTPAWLFSSLSLAVSIRRGPYAASGVSSRALSSQAVRQTERVSYRPSPGLRKILKHSGNFRDGTRGSCPSPPIDRHNRHSYFENAAGARRKFRLYPEGRKNSLPYMVYFSFNDNHPPARAKIRDMPTRSPIICLGGLSAALSGNQTE